MSNIMYNYILSVPFSKLFNWSVQYTYEIEHLYNNEYKCLPIGKFLTRVKDAVEIEDDKNYKRVSIKLYNGGITLRDIEKGINIGTRKQFRIKQGHFLLSKIDARNGAIGIVPETCDNAIITGNFWDFEINTNIIEPQFLTLLTTTKYFTKLFDRVSNGTTNRHYLQEDLFLNMEIPLPSIEKQKEIVEKYNAKIRLAEEQAQKIKILEKEIEDLWTNTLGLEFVELNSKETKTVFLNFAFLSQLTRWDIYNNTNDVKSIKYKFSKLKDIVIGKPLYGAGEKGVKNKSDVRYIRITDINEDGTLNNDFVSAEKVEEKYILKENDFLIARSGNTVGKTFLYKNEYGKCLYAGYLIKFELNINKIIPEYLLYYTKSKAYKTWILSNQRANAQPNINSEEYLNSPIIITDLATQKDLVNKISKIKTTIKDLKNSSEQNIILAQQEFEKELFE